MKRTRYLLAAALMLILAGVAWWWTTLEKHPSTSAAVLPAETPSNLPLVTNEPPVVVPPPRTGNKEDLHQWWLRMSKIDKRFEWKMPIEFYGKVVDETGLSVPGATVEMQWTDLSPTGSSERLITTDSLGYFILSGVNGKRLVVRIKKDGYAVYESGNRFSFEYAAYFEPEWHAPNASRPVIFKMHKLREADPLVMREERITLTTGKQTLFALSPREKDAAKLIIELQKNEPLRMKQWAARLSVPNGGLQPTLEEFPWEVPESDYKDTLVIDYNTPKPLGLDGGYQGGVFFIKTSQGYGRVEIKMVPGNNYARITSFGNPSGSRNLEFDPAKVIKPSP